MPDTVQCARTIQQCLGAIAAQTHGVIELHLRSTKRLLSTVGASIQCVHTGRCSRFFATTYLITINRPVYSPMCTQLYNGKIDTGFFEIRGQKASLSITFIYVIGPFFKNSIWLCTLQLYYMFNHHSNQRFGQKVTRRKAAADFCDFYIHLNGACRINPIQTHGRDLCQSQKFLLHMNLHLKCQTCE